MHKFNSQTGMHHPSPPYPQIIQSSKTPGVKYQTNPPLRLDTYEESKKRDHKTPNLTQANPPSAETRLKYTQKLKELVEQRLRGHGKRNKYYLSQATHRYNIIAQVNQVMRMEPTAQPISVLATNLQ